MDYTTLGRTGLRVSRVGLGGGGHSRLGQSTGRTQEESIRVVLTALELGINFIDTAEAYGTEEIVGKAIRSFPRESVVISTKVHARKDDRLSTPAEFRSRVEAGLVRLDVDCVDVLHIHGLSAADHPYAVSELVPVLLGLREEGKVRFIGVTEAFAPDPTHEMLKLAANDGCWDVVMVGFNILNQSARETVLPGTRRLGIGTLLMFAVRKALSNPSRLVEVVRGLVDAGKLSRDGLDLDNPLGFLVADGVAGSVTEAAYRYSRWEPGIDLVLSGTGNVEHLRDNVRYLSGPPLPTEVSRRLETMFRGVDSIVGN